MKTEKYTKGPWSTNHRGEIYAKHPTEKFDMFIGSVVTSLGVSHEDCEANGELIAAAPDLLQACQRLLKHLESVEDIHKGSDDDEIFARAAIAKATNNAEKKK